MYARHCAAVIVRFAAATRNLPCRPFAGQQFPRTTFPGTPFLVCVRRVDTPSLAELYPITLRESLPNIRVPLRPADPAIVLQLQPLVDQCYRSGRYATRIDYRKPPRPALSAEDERWVDALLREKGLRSS